VTLIGHVTQKWQFLIRQSIGGWFLIWARRNARGTQLNPAQLPPEVRSYFALDENHDRKARMDVGEDNTKDVSAFKALLEKNCKVRWQVPHAPSIEVKGIIEAEIRDVHRKKKRPTRAKNAIRNMVDLMRFVGADEPRLINKYTFKYSSCGYSVSVQLAAGTWVHNGDKAWDTMTEKTPIIGFSIQTIVEGSDVEVNMDPFEIPVAVKDVERAIEEMEKQADFYWKRDNLDHFRVTRDGHDVGYATYGLGEFELEENGEEEVSELNRQAMKEALDKQYGDDGFTGFKPGDELEVNGYTLEFYDDDATY
jgi:hypothetical protein